MKKLSLLFVLVLQICIFSQDKFRVDFDYARFFYNDSSGYLEIYYSFYQSQMMPLITGGKQDVKGGLNVVISSMDKPDTLINRNYQFLSEFDTASLNKSLTGNLGFVVPFGQYHCLLMGMDDNDSTKFDSLSFSFKMNGLPEDKFSISDIELANSIKKAEKTNSLFYKNSYEVVPNPSGLYGQSLPVIFYYTEFYNINKDVQSPSLKIDALLLNSANKTVMKKIQKAGRTNKSIVDVGTLTITKIPTGTYTLVISGSDSLKSLTVYSTKKLFIYNPSVKDTTEVVSTSENDYMSSEFATMSDEELNNIFDESKYIATPIEVSKWKRLGNAEAKRKFLFDFWKDRQSDIDPKISDNKNDYFKRVKEANEKYRTIQKAGWKTDRGRIHIIYGQPSEIERFPNQNDAKPYEIWHYNDLQGGVYFVFGDLTGFNDYELLSSTARGEIRDDNWFSKLQQY
jgi:GWxTD domain-containing protein